MFCIIKSIKSGSFQENNMLLVIHQEGNMKKKRKKVLLPVSKTQVFVAFL